MLRDQTTPLDTLNALLPLALYTVIRGYPEEKGVLRPILSHPRFKRDVMNIIDNNKHSSYPDIYNLISYLQLTQPQEMQSDFEWLS